VIVLVTTEADKTGRKKGRAWLFCLSRLGIFSCYLPSSLAYLDSWKISWFLFSLPCRQN